MMKIQRSFRNTSGKGTLYVVATPIGNLEDMTFRAVRMLKEVDWIAAEDTRQTRKLLNFYDISARLISYHEHNKQSKGLELVQRLTEGQSIALVSDAGMPAISDPGYDLVKLAIEQGVDVVPIPGANAALSALVISGLPTDRFIFGGFLPRDKKQLRQELDRLKTVPATVIIYESPHRIAKTLRAILDVFGNRQVAVARELTKKFEEVIRGQLQECCDYLDQHEPQGEYCVLIEGYKEQTDQKLSGWWDQLTLEEHVARYEQETGDRKEAMKLAARDRHLSKRDVYNQLVRDKGD